ncbi:MAG: preprotein translocase subunit SecA [Verrucomicrobia bacterium]|nr:preprotein translocase subunit SecA [Verrucomicrobiota bacterium]MBV8481231.1 preprotein translocase subunit SecA [Verrucomicrobiota bacterium]
MANLVLKAILGSKNQREVRRLKPLVARINELEQQYQKLSDDEVRAKSLAWKSDLANIDDPDELARRLNEILPEAFALVKNAARRHWDKTWQVCDQPVTWNMIHFDVQLMGGIALHQGRIAEMATGEGKTLVATCPIYLNALSGRGAHLVTVNDYLARRDAEWMGEIYRFLGLSVGCIQHDQSPGERKAQYDCDVTYGTNSEFGFDYLRDNGMATSKEQQVQRGHYYAIVDEVDSILIDEARTPLIISGPATVSSHQYDKFKPLVEQLVKRQTMLCNRLASEAKEALDKGDTEEAGRLLFKVKLGQPRNKGLLRMMEDPENRKALDKSELSFYQDSRKDELVALKEELYFAINERQQEADLSEMGRSYLNPDDPDAFVLPDLISEFTEIDLTSDLTQEQKDEKKRARQQYCDSQAERIHNISQLLRAYCLFERDVEYVVEENKVVIVDEHTGRKMPGRRWSDGLHQAVEAKEGVQIDRETQTLATITIQNYFRLYHKLSGMTGTAETEANEFHDIYKLDVVVIPTNRPCIRKDFNDRIYKTRREKYNAVIDEIKNCYAKGQPVLVGTASVDASELVSRMLKREKIPHNVLNAKYHRQEAEIVARAGQRGTVTISTNMAGRGTDIKLGDSVPELGGLHVLATERHESRRVDRQLRGRCARQGDPGSSRFYVSFEDDLMRNFGASERMTAMMERFGLKEGEELEHVWLNKSVETAQKRVEQRNYQIRKRTLDFDDVMNKQREVIYALRNEALETTEPRTLIFEIVDEVVPERVREYLEPVDGSDPNPDGLLQWVNTTFPLALSRSTAKLDSRTLEENSAFITEKIKTAYGQKVLHEESEAVTGLERYILLNGIDRLWQEHLYAMDGLREGIYLRSYGQKDPLVEYKAEAYDMFSQLMGSIKSEVLSNLFRSTTNLMAFEQFLATLPFGLNAPDPAQAGGAPRPPGPGPIPRRENLGLSGGQPAGNGDGEGDVELVIPQRQKTVTVGRNEPCPCGSGKKYKNCHGRIA